MENWKKNYNLIWLIDWSSEKKTTISFDWLIDWVKKTLWSRLIDWLIDWAKKTLWSRSIDWLIEGKTPDCTNQWNQANPAYPVRFFFAHHRQARVQYFLQLHIHVVQRGLQIFRDLRTQHQCFRFGPQKVHRIIPQIPDGIQQATGDEFHTGLYQGKTRLIILKFLGKKKNQKKTGEKKENWPTTVSLSCTEEKEVKEKKGSDFAVIIIRRIRKATRKNRTMFMRRP